MTETDVILHVYIYGIHTVVAVVTPITKPCPLLINPVIHKAQDSLSHQACPLLLACWYGAINRFAELDDLIGQWDSGGALPIADLAKALTAGVPFAIGKSFLLS
jgi:hypothetical protein